MAIATAMLVAVPGAAAVDPLAPLPAEVETPLAADGDPLASVPASGDAARAIATAAPSLPPAIASPAVLPVPAAERLPLRSVTQPPRLPLAEVNAFYNRYRLSLWFRGGQPRSAAYQLVNLLERAPLDGLAAGPQLAAQVRAAINQSLGGDPAMIASSERLLSAAWTLYVDTVRRPTPGMIYAYPSLQPQGNSPDLILRSAAAAPSLERHVQEVAEVNRIYAQLREAGWQQLQETGTVDPRLPANMERARSIPANGRFILVNAAAQRLWLYENGRPIDSMKVIVGMDELPTPLIASIIHYTTFNPYWNVPDHLVRKTLAPRVLKDGISYLKKNGYEVMSDWTTNAVVMPASEVDWKAVAAGERKVRVRQLPGPTNSMGMVKFPFPNGEGIYLHDTPNKELFTKDLRTISNGCVRLEDAPRLARWLLGREPVAPSPEPEQFVPLPQGVPVFITYLTVQPIDGQLTFAKDIYGWDSKPNAVVALHQ